MHSITDILNILLKSIFVGFGFVMPILALIKTSNLKALQVKDLFILTSIQAVRLAGIIYFILAVKDLYPLYFGGDSYEQVNVDYTNLMVNWMFAPALYLLLSQVFWIKKIYMKKKALIVFSVLVLILPSYFVLQVLLRSIFIFTTSDRDYLPSYWIMYEKGFGISPVLGFVLNIIVFIFIIFTIILLGGKLKDKKA